MTRSIDEMTEAGDLAAAQMVADNLLRMLSGMVAERDSDRDPERKGR